MRKIIFFSLLFLLLSLISCTSSSRVQGKGIEVQVLNPDLNEIYYDHSSSNIYELEVNLHNVGKSVTSGVLYVNGFNPNILEVEKNMPPSLGERLQTCFVKFNDFGIQNKFGVYCQDFGATVTRGQGGSFDFRFSASNFDFLNRLGIDNLDFTVNYDPNSNRLSVAQFIIGSQSFDFNCRNANGRLDCTGSFVLSSDNEERYVPGAAFLAYFKSLINLTRNGRGYEFELLGNDPLIYPGGEQTTITIPIKVKNFPKQYNEVNQNLVLTLLYPYTTYVSVPICLATKSLINSKRGSCVPKGTYLVKDSGNAPLAIKRIKQTNVGKKIIFDIVVQNVGNGLVWDWTKAELLQPYVEVTDELSDAKNVVYVGSIYVGGVGKEAINCFLPLEGVEGNNTLYRIKLLPKKETSFKCVMDLKKAGLSNFEPYSTAFSIELWYLYQQDIKVPLKIKKVI